ncbi:hypothetical protein ACYOEI_19195 [Singulisphaera rosea]
MKRKYFAILGFAAITVVAITAMAQLPDEVPQNALTPGRPAGIVPGNLDLNSVDRNAPPFVKEAGALVAPAEVKTEQGKTVTVTRSIVESVSTPAYGYIHQFGSFQITSSTAEGMFMLSAQLPFPDNRRSVDFYHAALSYVGKFTDPTTGITGYLYQTTIGAPVNDTRFFLFGDSNLNFADPDSNGVRWMVYYNGQGQRTFSTTARFYRP